MGLPTSAGHGTRQWPIESGDLGRREIPVCSPTAIMHDADARSRDGKEVQACRATPARRKLRSRTQEPGTPKNDHSPMRTPCRGSTRFNAPPRLSPNTPCPCLVCLPHGSHGFGHGAVARNVRGRLPPNHQRWVKPSLWLARAAGESPGDGGRSRNSTLSCSSVSWLATGEDEGGRPS